MSTPRTERCLSDHLLDRVLVGELVLEGEASAHLETCARCSARIDLFREDAARFVREIPIDREVKAVKRRARISSVRRSAVAIMSLAALVLIALVLIPPEEPAVRTKGGLTIEVIARHGEDGRVETLLPGAKLSPGDAIRFRVASEEDGYLAIAGLDSAQVVSIYHRSMKIERGSRLLDGSIVLDATLGPEQIAALVCSEVPEEKELLGAARAALERANGDPRRVSDLPLGCKQAFFLIEKVPR